jgi:hypothetical protein
VCATKAIVQQSDKGGGVARVACLQYRDADFEHAHGVHMLRTPIERVSERREGTIADARYENRIHGDARLHVHHHLGRRGIPDG